ncbi:MAG: HAD family hydrolase [Anaerorhabdus sp.]|uniref:HAD family hydrolase n=1 Tax=Anaerorhabdus sp. TaxID=1872524 RepID=UPI003A8A33A7
MTIKAMAFDIDGTLVPRNCNNMSQKTREVLENLKKKNYPLVLITSRSFYEMKLLEKTFFDLFDYIVISTGTLIFNKQTLIQKHILRKEIFMRLVHYLEKNNIMYGYSRNDFEFYYSQEASAELQEKYSALFSQDYQIRKLEMEDEVIDFIYLLEDSQINELHNFVNEHIELCDFKIHGQVKPAGINKGFGLREVAKQLQLKPSDFLVFGDGTNDISMFQEAGLSVAMANGSEEAKKHAKLICASDDNEGVACFIEDWLKGDINDKNCIF